MSEFKYLTPSVFASFFVCHREAWLLYNGISPYQDHPLLEEGKAIHSVHYLIKKSGHVSLENMIIDTMKRDFVIEIKKSSRRIFPAKMQILFELFYLKHEKGIVKSGLLLIPEEKKSLKVELTEENERYVRRKIDEVLAVVSRDAPPRARRKSVCKSCSFYTFCYGEEINEENNIHPV